MIEQNGHAVTTVSAPVARSCLNRTSLMRDPGSSSLSANSRPPPAPQQNGFSRLRSGSAIVGAMARQQPARLVDLPRVAAEIARIVERHALRRAGGEATVSAAVRRRTPPSARSRRRSRTGGSRRRSSSRSADTTSGSSSDRPPSGPRCCRSPAPGTCTRCRCAWPDRPCSAPSTARRSARPARAGSRTAIASISGSRPRTRRRIRARPARRASTGRRPRGAADVDELLPLIVAEPPDIAAPLQVIVDAAQTLGRVAVRHQAAPGADEDRQMLDADRTLVLAGAARRALPEHLLGVDLGELSLAIPGEQRLPASAG